MTLANSVDLCEWDSVRFMEGYYHLQVLVLYLVNLVSYYEISKQCWDSVRNTGGKKITGYIIIRLPLPWSRPQISRCVLPRNHLRCYMAKVLRTTWSQLSWLSSMSSRLRGIFSPLLLLRINHKIVGFDLGTKYKKFTSGKVRFMTASGFRSEISCSRFWTEIWPDIEPVKQR